jgi:hypothetical protein
MNRLPRSAPTVIVSMSTDHRSTLRSRPCIELLDGAIVGVLRRKTPSERVAMIFAANRTMRLRLEGHLRTRHPDWDNHAVMQEIARRMLGGAG